MGANDDREKLEVAQEECGKLERENAELAREYDALLAKQGDLLTAAVNVLRGDPPPLTTWSHHDVAELAREMKAERDAAEQRETETVGRFSEARRRALKAEAKVAEQQALIERAFEATKGRWPYARETAIKVDRLRTILSTSGTEALEARDAEKWDEGYTVGNRHDGRRDANPYRKAGEQSNG